MWRKPCGKKNIVGFFIFCFSVAVVVVVILFTDPHISLRNKLQYISALKVQWRWCWSSSLRMQGPEPQIESPLTLGKLVFFLTLVLWPHHLVPFLQLNYQRNTMFTNPVQMLNISQSIKKKERPCNTILRPESTTPHYINPNMSWNVATFPQFPLWADIDPSLFLLFFALKSLVIFFILYIPKHFKNLALI